MNLNANKFLGAISVGFSALDNYLLKGFDRLVALFANKKQFSASRAGGLLKRSIICSCLLAGIVFIGMGCQDDISGVKGAPKKVEEPEERLESPKEVTGLRSESGNLSVALTWDALESLEKEEAGYRIYMDGQLIIDNHSSTSIVINSDNTDLCCANGTVYAFRVSAFNKAGEGAKSDEVTSAPRPSELERLVPESPTSGDSFVILSWNRVEEATEYRIYRNKGGSTPINHSRAKIIADAEITSYRDGGLQNGVRYRYEVEPVMMVTDPDAEIKGPRGEFSAKPIADREGRPELLVAIADNTSDLASVTLTITAVKSDIKNSTADEYKILVRKTSDDSIVSGIPDQTITPVPLDGGDAGTSITTHTVAGLEYLTEVEISVVPIRGTVEIPADAVEAFFLPRAAPLGDQTAPRLTLPGEGERPNEGVLVEWDALSRTTHYQIKRKEVGASGPAVTVVGRSNGAIAGFTNEGVCCSRLDANAADNKRYIYTLQAFRMKLINGRLTELSRSTVSPDTSIDTTVTPPPPEGEVDPNAGLDAFNHVDTFIGIGKVSGAQSTSLDTFSRVVPAASSPFGLVRVSTLNSHRTSYFWHTSWRFGNSGDGYFEHTPDKLGNNMLVLGFSMNSISGPGCPVKFDFPFMVYPGDDLSEEFEDRHTVNTSPVKGGNGRKLKGYKVKGTNPDYERVGQPGYLSYTFKSGQTNDVDELNMKAEFTATRRAGIGKFTFSGSPEEATILFTSYSSSSRNSGYSWIKYEDGKIIGQILAGEFCNPNSNDYRIYMAAQISESITSDGATKTITTGTGKNKKTTDTDEERGFVVEMPKNKTIYVKFALSYTSTEKAEANLAEISNFDFDGTKTKVQEEWKSILSSIEIKDTWPDPVPPAKIHPDDRTSDKRIFYTAFWRMLQHPTIYQDLDGSYRGYDNKVHNISEHTTPRALGNMYTDFSGWDIYRFQTQFLGFIFPEMASDMAQSLIVQATHTQEARKSEESSNAEKAKVGIAFPRWTVGPDDALMMHGNPGQIIVANMYAFGARNFDIDKAWEITTNEKTGKVCTTNIKNDLSSCASPLPEYGWFKRNAVSGSTYYRKGITKNASDPDNPGSKTIEYATAEFAKAQMAKFMYEIETNAAKKNQLAIKYSNYIQSAGRWREVIAKTRHLTVSDRPKAGACTNSSTNDRCAGTIDLNSHSSSFYEGTAAQYRWVVPYDGSPLFERATNSAANAKTPEQILEYHMGAFDSATDKTSGMYIGNQVCVATPWLFNYKKKPTRTQHHIREVMEELFNDGIDYGVPGNDDLGTLSGWYVAAALGIAPTVPGVGIFLLNTPFFKEARVYRILKNIGSSEFTRSRSDFRDAEITIKAGSPKTQKFISGMTLKKAGETSGTAYNKSYITAKDLQGATLEFTTTDTESKADWAEADSSIPPSMSKEGPGAYDTVADQNGYGKVDHAFKFD